MCDGVALEAWRSLDAGSPNAVEEPGNLVARGGMQVGACLAGVSFLKGLGLVHAISHMVGADFDTHHGLTNAIVLPAVLKFNAPAIDDKLPQVRCPRITKRRLRVVLCGDLPIARSIICAGDTGRNWRTSEAGGFGRKGRIKMPRREQILAPG
ncbi:MAG: hypothetical protein CM15mP125_2750 [Gammaproteobacteria bacterium]|nr:MAG: hypothetical protein CM15mP125_2750 [Gammaproteobacteria bacterium]